MKSFKVIVFFISFAIVSALVTTILIVDPWNISGDMIKGPEETDTKPHEIGREEAIAIASKFVSTGNYLDTVDAHATEFKDSWTVNFVSKPEYSHWFGGNSSVEVMKKDGSIGRFYFEK
ncbi:MAG: hypothetical protein R2684_17625 [Pyrinomonadaceae bacterium]